MSESERTKPRRLKGHKATATCCISSRDTPGLVLTTGEDGCVCWFDMRCEDAVQTMEVGKEPISSICFNSGNENIIYVSSGKEVKTFDIQLPAASKPLESYQYNKEEINQIACNSKSSFLAAADDAGDIKIIDVSQKCLYKTLRSGHTSRYVAVSNSFHGGPGKLLFSVYNQLYSTILSVISGGLDSKLVMWDFSKGRPSKIVDFGLPDNDGISSGQCYNPAFIHSIAVPDIEMIDKLGKICTVARGDGVVDVIDIESELAAIKSKTSSGSKNRQKNRNKTTSAGNQEQNGRKRLHLDYSLGGHTAAVSCVGFSQFGERGKFIISGGNDKSVKVWDWSRYHDSTDTSTIGMDILQLNINLSKKVNWLCTTPTESENLVVCDTTKVVKVYSVS